MEFDLKKSPRLLAKLLTGQSIQQGGVIRVWNNVTLGAVTGDDLEKLGWMIELAAKQSARAQGLRAPITTIAKLQAQSQTLHLCVQRLNGDRIKILGLLKTGRKKLFLRNQEQKYCPCEPVCVLDFYVQEQHQRMGIGHALFQAFMTAFDETASSVAYDSPSPKLLSFLRKHFGLEYFEPQDNKFVVFPEFWVVTSNHAANGHGEGHASQWTSVAARPLTPTRRRANPMSAAGSRPPTVHGFPI